MKKIFNKLHLWLSIPLGIIISVICLTGAILVFQTEISEVVYPERYFIKDTTGEKLPIKELIPKVNEQLTDNSVLSIQIPSDPSRNYILGGAGRVSIYVDPYTAEIVGTTQRGAGFFGKTMQLHRWLLDSNRTVGKQIVGYSTILFVFILITGIVIWWPKTKKQLKNRLQIKTKYGLKRFWWDLHISGGMYVTIGLLILSLTGLTYSFRWYSTGFYGLLGIEMPAQGGHQSQGGRGEHPSGEGRGNRGSNATPSSHGNNINPEELDISQWENVFVKVKSENPNSKTISISNGSVAVAQIFTFGNSRAADRYTFDLATGKITDHQPYENQPRSTKARGWVYSLHVGSWGGWFSKIITCIISLTGAFLPITGYYMFYKKRKKHKKKA